MGNFTSRENGGNVSQGNSHDSGDVLERPSKRLKVSRTSVAISNDTNEENKKNDVIKTLTLPPEVWAMVSLRCTIFNSHSLGITTYANLLVKHDVCHLNICTNWSNMTSVTRPSTFDLNGSN